MCYVGVPTGRRKQYGLEQLSVDTERTWVFRLYARERTESSLSTTDHGDFRPLSLNGPQQEKSQEPKEDNHGDLAGFWLQLCRPPHVTGVTMCYRSVPTWEICVLCRM